jgi:ubiquinone/menaquinone biosynthesis C-methylase UbiE
MHFCALRGHFYFDALSEGQMSSVHTGSGRGDWKSDFFGTLNELPPEPVGGIAHVLDAMSTLPAFRDARQWVFRNLGLQDGSAVMESGCGTGTALPEILPFIGPKGRVTGNDPTHAFIDSARARASSMGVTNARYDVGDIRSISAEEGEYDAVFCDKVLIHAGPPISALSELVRVTRSGGRIGIIEWLPFFAVSCRQVEALEAFNAIFRKAVYDYYVCLNLEYHFHCAGLKEIRSQTSLAHTDDLNAHPFWRAFMFQQLPMFIHAGLVDESTAERFQSDLQDLNKRGEFNASFIVRAVVGIK